LTKVVNTVYVKGGRKNGVDECDDMMNIKIIRRCSRHYTDIKIACILKLVVSVTKELQHIYLQVQKNCIAYLILLCFKCFILCAKNHVFLGEYYFHGKLNILKLLFSVLFVTT
jgi:hypothetical protein